MERKKKDPHFFEVYRPMIQWVGKRYCYRESLPKKVK